MITRRLTLTLLCPEGSSRSEAVSQAELDRKVMTAIIRSWVMATPDTLQTLNVLWNGEICAAYASAAPTSSNVLNTAATEAYAAFLLTRPNEEPSTWSPDGGKVCGPIVIDHGVAKGSPPDRSSEELLKHDWFGLACDARPWDAPDAKPLEA